MAKLDLESLKDMAQEISVAKGISYEKALELLVNGIEAELECLTAPKIEGKWRYIFTPAPEIKNPY